MVMIQPDTDPFRTVSERIATARRAAQHRERLQIAKTARCQARGCHPVLETISTMIVATGAWLNRRVAPPERRVRISGSPQTAQRA